MFILYIANVTCKIDNKERYLMLVFPDGEYELCYYSDFVEQSNLSIGLDACIFIDLNTLLKKHFDKDGIKPPIIEHPLTHEEANLLNIIRTNPRLKHLKIQFAEQKINFIEGVVVEDVDKCISELKELADFQNITLKQCDGKFVSIERTIKIK